MQKILLEAKEHFESLLEHLKSSKIRNEDFFTKLSINNEEAYVFMNQSMCASDTVCKDCALHRDYIREMLDVLSELELDASKVDQYKEQLAKYEATIETLVAKIKTALNQ